MSEQTPRYGHAPVAMKRLAFVGEIDNTGEFAWEIQDGVRYIILALPRPRPNEPNDYIMNRLPVVAGPNNPGKAWGWDSNEDQPTLTPSIHCIGHWHSWVRAGMLVEA
jgi:hypothetical protein